MKTWLSVTCAGLLLALLIVVSGVAWYEGQQTIQKKWDKQINDYTAQIDALKLQVQEKENTYRAKTKELNHDLDQAKQDHANAVAAVRAEYGQQLRASETRAAIYQRQAAAGTATCERLASHAARLDRSLAEGIGLVEELQRTLEFRESQNRALGQQIRNERELFGGTYQASLSDFYAAR